jgi:hypothetical protein
MSRLPPTRLVVAALALAAGMNVINPTSAEDINGPQTIFGGDRPGAERQARAEWHRVQPAEMACIDQRLKHKGSSVEALVRRGVTPLAARLIKIRSRCRDFVESVQMDAAPAFRSDAAVSPTPTVPVSNANTGVLPPLQPIRRTMLGRRRRNRLGGLRKNRYRMAFLN